MRSSVVIVSYRPGDWLAAAVASVVDHADEVVVVDNGAGGEAAAIARAGGARAVTSATNRGFAGGAAAGMAAASGDVVGVLNDDAVAEPSWLPSAAAQLQDPSVGAVTPKVLLAGTWAQVVLDDEVWRAPGDARHLGRQLRSITVDGVERLERAVGVGIHRVEADGSGTWRWTTGGGRPFYVPAAPGQVVEVDGERTGTVTTRLINHAGAYLHPDGVAGEIGFGVPDDGRLDATADVFGFSGTAPVFSRRALERVGGFAPPFFAYNEDTDWCLRAHLAGLRVVYDPGGVVHHRLSATSGGTSSELVRLLVQRNAVLAVVRNAPSRVATDQLRQRWPVMAAATRRSTARWLPWALATRTRHGDKAAVWQRWCGRDREWPTRAAR